MAPTPQKRLSSFGKRCMIYLLRVASNYASGHLITWAVDQVGTHSSLHFPPNETVKAVGILWKPESDELCFDSNISVYAAAPTMLSIVSAIAKMYDPLG
uniref:Uncharacterized protein n=1 Tax=Anopheles christyi TaxID=43041 RepID=A0A182KDB7_9DIPT